MTFNIWNYNRPWSQRRWLIADLIQAHQPHAVALQETRHDWRFEGRKGQGEQLGALTGYHATWAVGQVYFPILRVDEGLTILTRDTPLRVMERRLTIDRRQVKDQNQRVCLGVRVAVDGMTFDVYDSHFSLSEAARQTNALEVARFIQEESSSHPAFLMGDLNCEPDTPPIRFLLGEESFAGVSGDFRDCWTSARPEDPGYTYASFEPVRRIDYVLGRNLPAGRLGAEVVGGTGVDGIYPSDHMGIVVELHV